VVEKFKNMAFNGGINAALTLMEGSMDNLYSVATGARMLTGLKTHNLSTTTSTAASAVRCISHLFRSTYADNLQRRIDTSEPYTKSKSRSCTPYQPQLRHEELPIVYIPQTMVQSHTPTRASTGRTRKPEICKKNNVNTQQRYRQRRTAFELKYDANDATFFKFQLKDDGGASVTSSSPREGRTLSSPTSTSTASTEQMKLIKKH
jgi:hypothetical protein